MPSLTILTLHKTFTFQKMQILMTKEIPSKQLKRYISQLSWVALQWQCYITEYNQYPSQLGYWLHYEFTDSEPFSPLFPSFSLFIFFFPFFFPALPFLPSSPPSPSISLSVNTVTLWPYVKLFSSELILLKYEICIQIKKTWPSSFLAVFLSGFPFPTSPMVTAPWMSMCPSKKFFISWILHYSVMKTSAFGIFKRSLVAQE